MTPRVRYLTEAQAWRKIARRIDGGEPQFLYARMGSLLAAGRISEQTYDTASDRVRAYDGGSDYDRCDREDMVIAALWLALEAADDAKSARRRVGGHEA